MHHGGHSTALFGTHALHVFGALHPAREAQHQRVPTIHRHAHQPTACMHCSMHACNLAPQNQQRLTGPPAPFAPSFPPPPASARRQQVVLQPTAILPKIVVGVARSAAFLTSFIALAFGGACVGFNLTGTCTGPVIAASTWPGGLATLLEKKSRRMELALYCASRAAESFSRCGGRILIR